MIDAATKQVVGWAFADHMRTDLVIDALHAAVRRKSRVRPGIIVHSDRGSQYTSNEFGQVCALYTMKQSMGHTGVCPLSGALPDGEGDCRLAGEGVGDVADAGGALQ